MGSLEDHKNTAVESNFSHLRWQVHIFEELLSIVKQTFTIFVEQSEEAWTS